MAKPLFITGTDTEVGKTFVSVAILRALALAGKTTVAMKPVAAGCDGNGHNEDALALQGAMTADLPYAQINPVALKTPVSPHIAAEIDGKRVTASRLEGLARGLMLRTEDVLLIEGAGGWFCPLNNKETLADFVRRLEIPVVMVVGMKLGCLNHALLTAQTIRSQGLELVGWVANCIDPEMQEQQHNIDYLRAQLAAPCLGIVPFAESASDAAEHLNVSSFVSPSE